MTEWAKRVLVVEDDADDYLILERLFAQVQQPRFMLERASDYEEAVAAMARKEHDIYIFDYRLGARDGIELIHEARLLGCEVPVIMVTGDYDPVVGQAALVAGATDFVPKNELTPELLARLVRYAQVRVAAQSELRERATQDEVTQTFNRTHMLGLLQAELNRCERYQRGMAVLMMDIDGFTEINEKYGRLLGDNVLQAVANACHRMLRQADIVCRYGSDEFCLLLPQTDAQGVRSLSERLRAAVEALPMRVGRTTVKITVSMGAVAITQAGEVDLAAILDALDRNVFAARQEGGNRVVSETL